MSESNDTNTWDAKMDTVPEETQESDKPKSPWHKLAFIVLIPIAIITGIFKLFMMMGSWLYSPKNY